MYAEGSVKVYSGNAFVNSAARLTRDLGIALSASLLPRGYSILDSTAATGIRGMRYLKEGGASECTFLEINGKAYGTLRRNLARNGVKGTCLNTSIQEFCNSQNGRFDLIELDPFGGVQPYMNDVMKVVKDGSLLFATATDTAVLCGAHHSACVRLYGSLPMHNELCKEAGVRILLGYIARVAASFDFGVEPVLSMAYLHYMRVHVRLRHGSKNAMASMKDLGFVFYCSSCGRRGIQKGLIPRKLDCECGSRLQLSGPLWAGALHSKGAREVCTSLSTKVESGSDRAFLSRLASELDALAAYDIPRMTRRLGIRSASPYRVIELLLQRGNMASQAHFNQSCIRTDAPFDDVVSAVRRASRKSGKGKAKAPGRSSANAPIKGAVSGKL